MALKDNDVNWWRPLWKRIAVVAFLAIWLAWEVFFTGEQLWMVLVGAALAYALYNFFITFPKEKPSDAAISPAPPSEPKDGQDS